MNFRHFILTRFNINITAANFSLRLEDTWLSLRFDLFQRFCFPSVRGQSCQDFTWLVLFDEQTPKLYQRVIAAYAAYANFLPLFCGPHDTVLPQAVAKMRELAPEAEWLLTTRLDNDDALAKDFVRCLHEVARSADAVRPEPGGPVYINFPMGLQYHENRVYDFADLTNAFVSLLEPAESAQTVFWVDHPAIYDKAPVIQAKAKPMWLQNVHGTNVYNYLRGVPVKDADPLRDFALEL